MNHQIGSNITYHHNDNKNMEVIYYLNSKLSYPVHTHVKHYTIGYVLDGVISIEHSSNMNCCQAGEFFVILPDTAHSFGPTSEFYTMISICIQSDFLYNNDFEDTVNALETLLKRFPAHKIDLSTHISSIKDALTMIYASLIGLSSSLERYTCELKERIMKSPEGSFSIESMSKMVSVSSYHLIRQFKTDTGLSPHQFQLQARIRKAQQLLADDLPVIEVAYATGFCDQSHFDRYFKKMVGISPSDYRSALQ